MHEDIGILAELGLLERTANGQEPIAKTEPPRTRGGSVKIIFQFFMDKGEMMMRFVKQVVVVTGLLAAVQSAWAVCEAEIKLAVETYGGDMRSELNRYELESRKWDRNTVLQEVRDLTQVIDAGLKGDIESHDRRYVTYRRAKLCLAKARL